MPTSRPMTRAALAAAALALGLLTAPAVSAAPAGTGTAVRGAAYTVTARTDTDVHAGPGSSSPRRGLLRAGHAYAADCWLVGEAVTADGRTSGVWVHVLGDRDTAAGFVGVVFLLGDDRAGLPASAGC
ncbi:SH3 domain-containing protein [Streptomyces sp. NPDC096934]|uniref:SH3 domain-containing protein n=1 Tax=Streptomyces sp. NPDC096934 TaxID=3155551 RepID=UPI0033311220